MSFWKKWGKSKQETPTHLTFTVALKPEKPLFVIGDIHGRIDLLELILKRVPNDAKLIFVGDLIDRGDNSNEVLSRVKSCCEQGATCLMGNHERMLLDFLERPTERGPRWLRYGGLQVFQSYGVRGVTERTTDNDLLQARDNLEAAFPEGMVRWIKALPLQWRSGNVHVVHAAADPEVDMEEQSSRVLLWGTSSFKKQPRTDGQWVIHGHTIVDQPSSTEGRISIDTGGYATGILTAAYVTEGSVEFISV